MRAKNHNVKKDTQSTLSHSKKQNSIRLVGSFNAGLKDLKQMATSQNQAKNIKK